MTLQINAEDTASIFTTLNNPNRREILRACTNDKLTADDLSKKISINKTALKKHLYILYEEGLLSKKNSRFGITPHGFACIQNANSVEFLARNTEFFAEHTFGDIPDFLMRRIGSLNNSEFVYGFHLVLPRWSQIVVGAKRHLKLLFIQPPIVLADSIKQKAESKLDISLLVGENSKITECNEFVKNLELQKTKTDTRFQKRRCKKVQVSLVMSENSACIIFPDRKGLTSMHGNFISSDPDFVKWCHDFFYYKWKDGEQVSRIR